MSDLSPSPAAVTAATVTPTAMPADAGPPQPPQPPEPGDCCHSGCEFCVDDMYQGELDRYRVALQAWQERQAALQTTVASPPGAT